MSRLQFQNELFFKFLKLLGLRLVLIDESLLILSPISCFVLKLISFPVLVALEVLLADVLSLFDVFSLEPFLIVFFLYISHLLLFVFIQSHLYHVSFVRLRLHQLLLGLLDFLGLLGSDISEGLSTLRLIPLGLSHLLLFQLPEELLVVFVLQALERLSFVLGLVYLFLSSLVLHLKHSDSISEELDIIFNPIKNAIKFKT